MSVPNRIRVGIIGLNPERGWALMAHVPALRALPDYEITAVCTSRAESAAEAARARGIAHAFDDPQAMAAHPDVDLVVVTVKVPEHDRLVRAALNAGKHVYCEWPLAMDVAEAQGLLQLAETKGVQHLIGLQSRASPVIRHLRQLIADGYVGRVRSSSVIASGMVWGPFIDAANAYILDARHRVTMETVPFGHFVDAFTHCLGPFRELSAMQACFYPQVLQVESGQMLAKTASDQLVVQGALDSGAVASIHYRGGSSRAGNFSWEINGSDGDLLVTADIGHMQMASLSLRGARGQDTALTAIEIPAALIEPAIPLGPPWHVGHLYASFARKLRGEPVAVPDFRDALANHRLIECVERAAREGCRVSCAG